MRNAIPALALGIALAGAPPAAAQTIQTISFALAGPTNGIEDVAAADMDLDGDQDLICAYRVGPAATAASVVTIAYNNGSTTPFAQPLTTSTTTIVGTNATRIQIRVGDLVPGFPATPPEIVVFSPDGGVVRLFVVLSSPSGLPNTFTVTAATVVAPPLAGFDDFVLSDYNLDALLDIVAVVPGTSALNPDQIQVFVNGGAAPFATLGVQALPTVSNAQRMCIAAGPIDPFTGGANNDDILIRSGPPGAEQITIMLGDVVGAFYGGGTIYFFSPANAHRAVQAMGVALAQFNLGADVAADAEVYFPGTNAHVLANPTSIPPSYGPTFTTSPNAGGVRGIVVTGDLDGDNDIDTVSGDGSGNVCVHVNDGTGNFNVGFPGPFTLPANGAVQALFVGNVGAGSGAADLVVATTSSTLEIWVQ